MKKVYYIYINTMQVKKYTIVINIVFFRKLYYIPRKHILTHAVKCRIYNETKKTVLQ